MTLTHVTLNTGHTRQSPRSEVADDIVLALAPLLRRALRGERVDIPAAESHTMAGGVDEDCCVVTTYAMLREHGAAPLLTTFVAAQDGPAADRLWASFATDILQPRAPWCADKIYDEVAVIDQAAFQWTGDWARCVAWTWIERVAEEVRRA